MADTSTVVHIGENSPEEVAHKLYRDIAVVELHGNQPKTATRQWILDTYAECLIAVRTPLNRRK